jgi:iron complex transport system permease protein
MLTGSDVLDMNKSYDLYMEKRGRTRKLFAISILAFILLFAFSMCLRTSQVGRVPFGVAMKNLFTWVKLAVAKWFNLPVYLESENIIAQSPFYFETIARFKISVITVVSGVMLALAGALYQGVFRNPIAAPTMLGVASGIELGILVLVLKYAGAAYFMTSKRYTYCYGFALVILLIVLFTGKVVSRGRRFAVTDMLLVGTAISQVVGVLITYYRFEMEDELLIVFQEISSGIYINIHTITFIILGAAFIVSIIPVHLLRYSFNAVCFSDDDAFTMGINPVVIRFITLAGGTIMITAAMIHCGSVGMISLIVPHICRYLFGSDFKKIYYASGIFGGMLLLLCRDISALFYFGYSGAFPIGTIVNIIAAPIFIIVLFQQRKGWE